MSHVCTEILYRSKVFLSTEIIFTSIVPVVVSCLLHAMFLGTKSKLHIIQRPWKQESSAVLLSRASAL